MDTRYGLYMVLDDKSGETRSEADLAAMTDAVRLLVENHGFGLTGVGPHRSLWPLALFEMAHAVRAGWPIDKGTYPKMDGESDPRALINAVLHLAKASGDIAAAVEPSDHGRQVDSASLKQHLGLALIDLLRVASLAGISTLDLYDVLLRWREDRSYNP